MLWRGVYKHNRNVKDYTNYKDAINLATFEIRQSKRTFDGIPSKLLNESVVTPEMIAKKIKKIKNNKSPGVDGILPQLLKEIVEKN